jgi:hypothetical protein
VSGTPPEQFHVEDVESDVTTLPPVVLLTDVGNELPQLVPLP